MPFTEDLEDFFDLDEFGTEAVFTTAPSVTKSIVVIFNDPTQPVEMYDTQIEAEAAFLHCKASDLNGIRRGNPVTVEGNNYTVNRITRDGTGTAMIFLRTA